MESSGKKVVKTQKTKFRKNQDSYENVKQKPKHHDKSFYRLLRQEKEEKDYVV